VLPFVHAHMEKQWSSLCPMLARKKKSTLRHSAQSKRHGRDSAGTVSRPSAELVGFIHANCLFCTSVKFSNERDLSRFLRDVCAQRSPSTLSRQKRGRRQVDPSMHPPHSAGRSRQREWPLLPFPRSSGPAMHVSMKLTCARDSMHNCIWGHNLISSGLGRSGIGRVELSSFDEKLRVERGLNEG